MNLRLLWSFKLGIKCYFKLIIWKTQEKIRFNIRTYCFISLFIICLQVKNHIKINLKSKNMTSPKTDVLRAFAYTLSSTAAGILLRVNYSL